MNPTMKLGEFRKQTADLPDDTDILMDMGDLQFAETHIRWILPPVLDHPHAITMEMGQIWNYELDLDARVDAKLL